MSTTRRKWKVDWKAANSSSSSSSSLTSSSNNASILIDGLRSPPGFQSITDSSNGLEGAVMTEDAVIQAKQRQVMAIAYSPGKNLLSTAFMLWMSGSSIQIFSIMATGMALVNPLKALASINQVFEKFNKDEGVDLRLPKLVFVALQLLSIGVALYKCSTMGLLPVTSADWTSLLPEKHFLEASAIPMKF